MKGRGTRTLDADDLKKVTPSATTAKTHYVIVDAVGVTKSLKTASQPLITKPSVPLKDLAMGVMMGVRDEDTVSSLAGRLARLDKQLDDKEQARIKEPRRASLCRDIVRGLCRRHRRRPDRGSSDRCRQRAGRAGRRSAMKPPATSWCRAGRQRLHRPADRASRRHPPRQGADHRPRQSRHAPRRRLERRRERERRGHGDGFRRATSTSTATRSRRCRSSTASPPAGPQSPTR